MPSYATQPDLEERFSSTEIVAVADRDYDGVADAGVVAAALSDASELIDGYLAGRYQLPMASVPGVVKGWCCDIARRRLHKDEPPKNVIDAHDEALRQLRDVQAGRMLLQIAGVQASAASSSDSRVLYHSPERTFDSRSLSDI